MSGLSTGRSSPSWTSSLPTQSALQHEGGERSHQGLVPEGVPVSQPVGALGEMARKERAAAAMELRQPPELQSLASLVKWQNLRRRSARPPRALSNRRGKGLPPGSGSNRAQRKTIIATPRGHLFTFAPNSHISIPTATELASVARARDGRRFDTPVFRGSVSPLLRFLSSPANPAEADCTGAWPTRLLKTPCTTRLRYRGGSLV